MNTNKNRYLVTAVAVLCLVLGACNGGAGAGDGSKAEVDKDGKPIVDAAVPVEVVAAKRAPIVANYTGTATLEADRQAEVVAKTSGVLLKLKVEEGDQVRQGQVLAQLDPERAGLELARAEATLKRMENDFRRSKELYAAKLASSEAHDKIRFELDTQQAAYDLAKLELSYTTIVASIDGVISERMVKEGNLIQLQQTLFRIDDFDPLLAVLNVPERELQILKPGLPVTMSVDALPGSSFGGTVARVSPVVDAQTGTIRVTCEFRDSTNRLKSGMFGRLDVVYDERENALVVPREALIEEDGDTAVFVVVHQAAAAPVVADKDKQEKKPDPKATPSKPRMVDVAQRRTVQIGYTVGNSVEIRDGLKDGERVITVGRAAVRDGTEVQPLEGTQ